MAATYDAILRIAAKTTGASDVKALQGALGGLSSTAATLRGALGGLTGLGAALGAGLGVAGLAAAGKGIIDMADSLDELSQRTGTSVEMLSKLGLAARQSGIDTEQVSGAMVKLSRNLGEIAIGGGEKAAAALAALGISATDASGNLKTADQVLLEVADRFQSLPDGVMKAKVTMDLFGKGSAALIPMLNMGSDAIEKLNTGMSADFAKNAGIYNDQLANLQAQASALGAAVLTDLLPSLIQVTKFTATAIQQISEWYAANKGTIGGIASVLADAAKWSMLLGTALTAGPGAAMLLYKAMEENEKKTAGAAAAAVTYTSALGDAVLNAQDLVSEEDKIKQAKQQQLDLQKAQQRLYSEYVGQLAAVYQRETALSDIYSKRAEQRGQAAQNQLSIEEAQIGVARAYLDNRMALAKTDQERRAITLEIIELDRKAAAAQYQAAIAQIQVERDLSNLRTLEAERKLRQALEELRIAQALGTVTAQIQANAQSARSALMSAAVENAGVDKVLSSRQQVAALNLKAAQIGLAGRTQQAGGPAPSQQVRSYVTVAGIRIPQYAKGAFVTSPTLAQIGEGGEPEYVVPKSKAKNFAANVLTGTSGEQAVQRRNPYLIALQTLANDPGAYIRAADAFAPKGGWGRTEAEVFQGRQRALQSLGIGLERGFHFGGGSYRITKGVDVKAIRRAVEREASGGGSAGVSMSTMPRQVVNNIQTGPVQRRTDGDFVTLSDLERAVASAVDQTMAAVQKTARQPGYKRRTGSR